MGADLSNMSLPTAEEDADISQGQLIEKSPRRGMGNNGNFKKKRWSDKALGMRGTVNKISKRAKNLTLRHRKKSEKKVDETSRKSDVNNAVGENEGKLKETHFTWFQSKEKLISEETPATLQLLQSYFEDVFRYLSYNLTKKKDGECVTRKTVPKRVFVQMCRKLWGQEVDFQMFSKLFDYMDIDRNGKVDEMEFSIVSCFLLNRDITQSNTELAYKLFDSNRDGGISQKEFSEMLAAVVGGSLNNFYNIDVFRPSFDAFSKGRFWDSLSFYKEMHPYFRDSEVEPDIPIEEAEAIITKFFNIGSVDALNVHAGILREVVTSFDEYKEKGEEMIPLDVFEVCYSDVVSMLGGNALSQYKTYLRNEPYSDIVADTWEKFNKKPDELLNIEEFTEWVDAAPGVFDFLEMMQLEFAKMVGNLEAQQSSEELSQAKQGSFMSSFRVNRDAAVEEDHNEFDDIQPEPL